MNVRPLRGHCLVEVLPENKVSAGGIAIPDTAKAKDDVGRLPGLTGRVLRLGPWPQKKNGLAVIPEVAPGSKVFISQYAGRKVHEPGRNYRLVLVADILAKLDS